jgi:hypothetical protein
MIWTVAPQLSVNSIGGGIINQDKIPDFKERIKIP